jgi:hypothetical protein
MKKGYSIFLITIFVSGFCSLFAQGFQPPARGNAVVYFVRVSYYASNYKVQVLLRDKVIGELGAKSYIRYECPPGKYLFWVMSENEDFNTADLKDGGTYIAIVDIWIGFSKMNVGLKPISYSDRELFDRARDRIYEKPPRVVTPEKLAKLNHKFAKSIKERLYDYENGGNKGKQYRVLSSGMAIPSDALK